MKRLILFLVVISVFSGLWIHFNKITCKIVGLPSSVGPIQSDFEAPFFNKLPSNSKTSLTCQYVPSNKQGVKDSYLLNYLQKGFYDIASIRFRQAESSDIAIAGIDLPGLPIDLASARGFSEDFSPFLETILIQPKFQSKIIKTFVFGRQELFCTKPIRRLEDFRGLKIRITAGLESNIAKLLNALGSKPIQIEYGDTLMVLEEKLIDCGVSSFISAEAAGWFKYLPYRLNLNLGNGVNGYLINLSTWNSLSPRQKGSLTQSITGLTNHMWDFVEKSSAESVMPCSKSEPACKKRPQLIQVNDQEKIRIQQLAIDVVLIPWINSCEEIHQGCKSSWLRAAKNNLKFENLSLRGL